MPKVGLNTITPKLRQRFCAMLAVCARTSRPDDPSLAPGIYRSAGVVTPDDYRGNVPPACVRATASSMLFCNGHFAGISSLVVTVGPSPLLHNLGVIAKHA